MDGYSENWHALRGFTTGQEIDAGIEHLHRLMSHDTIADGLCPVDDRSV